MQCEEWADANSELFKEAHDETVHKNSYKRKLYELISASLKLPTGFQAISPIGGRRLLLLTQRRIPGTRPGILRLFSAYSNRFIL